MSRLAKFKAKGSDKTEEEWERILNKRRNKAYTSQIFVEKGERKFKGVIVNNER